MTDRPRTDRCPRSPAPPSSLPAEAAVADPFRRLHEEKSQNASDQRDLHASAALPSAPPGATGCRVTSQRSASLPRHLPPTAVLPGAANSHRSHLHRQEYGKPSPQWQSAPPDRLLIPECGPLRVPERETLASKERAMYCCRRILRLRSSSA